MARLRNANSQCVSERFDPRRQSRQFTPHCVLRDDAFCDTPHKLRLRITKGGTTYLPWVLDPANPAAAATAGDNVRDNVEQVLAQVTRTGNHDVVVQHEGTLLDGSPQERIVLRQGGHHGIVVILPEPGAALDVREQERDRTAG